jgi:hypothetical protein
MGHNGLVLRPRCTGTGRAQTQILFYSTEQHISFSISIVVIVGKVHLKDRWRSQYSDILKIQVGWGVTLHCWVSRYLMFAI